MYSTAHPTFPPVGLHVTCTCALASGEREREREGEKEQMKLQWFDFQPFGMCILVACNSLNDDVCESVCVCVCVCVCVMILLLVSLLYASGLSDF